MTEATTISNNYFTDQHFEMLRAYAVSWDEEIYNEWIHPIFVRISDYYCRVWGIDLEASQDVVSEMFVDIPKLDLSLKREQVFYYLCRKAVNAVSNVRKKLIRERERYVSIDTAISGVDEEEMTIGDTLADPGDQQFLIDDPAEFAKFIEFWRNEELVAKVFGIGSYTTNRELQTFRLLQCKLLEKYTRGEPKKGFRLHMKKTSVLRRVLAKMRKVMMESDVNIYDLKNKEYVWQGQ